MLKCSDPLFLWDRPCVLHSKVTISQLHSRCIFINTFINLRICCTEFAKRTEDAAIKAGEYLTEKVSKQPVTNNLTK